MSRRALPSRNRHFEFYETAQGKRLLRSKRLLESIEADLLSFGLVHGFRVDRNGEGGGFCVIINLEAHPVRYRRKSFLTEDEYSHLSANPVLSDLLRAGRWRM